MQRMSRAANHLRLSVYELAALLNAAHSNWEMYFAGDKRNLHYVFYCGGGGH